MKAGNQHTINTPMTTEIVFVAFNSRKIRLFPLFGSREATAFAWVNATRNTHEYVTMTISSGKKNATAIAVV